ncbi:hypothetical protein E4198_19905 [Streptomyces sp. RKND-216]|uniref:hypothetical protein n=1 Tax=Streptomyces sp. RKND-216 TaxID=2562581 RepID=UPI00109DED0C|nr:hypothetical protein E4198_19905 [Streptomyces sp. RKND-216]
MVAEVARELEGRRLALREGVPPVLTAAGYDVAERLAAAREASLAELLGGWWTPDRPRELSELVHELGQELCGADEEILRTPEDRP